MDIIKKFDAPESTNPDANPTPESDQTPKKDAKETVNENDEQHSTSLKQKIKDALQEWSNDNERDIQEDDNTPLRSGL